ncbi:ABC transporter permease, partial [Lactiplantibacillus plantarum]|uniref:ABC transporter permease n=1 Tax=Lactiplantibacillus plantarum TaxID=1590 RepID=UPI000AC176BE
CVVTPLKTLMGFSVYLNVQLKFYNLPLSKIIMLIIAVSFQVIVSVRDNVHQIPEDYYQTLKVLNANPLEIFFNIIWPASLPGVLSALRIALGTSFAILFFTEEYGTEIGLGYFIMDQWQRMNYPTMYAGIIIVSIIAYILFEVINISENYCTRWKK